MLLLITKEPLLLLLLLLPLLLLHLSSFPLLYGTAIYSGRSDRFDTKILQTVGHWFQSKK